MIVKCPKCGAETQAINPNAEYACKGLRNSNIGHKLTRMEPKGNAGIETNVDIT